LNLFKNNVTKFINLLIIVGVPVEFWERLSSRPCLKYGAKGSAEGADASKSLRQKGQNSWTVWRVVGRASPPTGITANYLRETLRFQRQTRQEKGAEIYFQPETW